MTKHLDVLDAVFHVRLPRDNEPVVGIEPLEILLRADADRNKAILDRSPASRWGEPADLGGTAVFLASRASDYVNGAVIPVDGGWLAR